MKKITMIKIPGCPYCAKAKKAFEELCQKPEYANAEVEVIDEQLQPELVTPYNGKYYYVPSLFIDGEKLFEAQPGQDYETIKAAVEKTTFFYWNIPLKDYLTNVFICSV